MIKKKNSFSFIELFIALVIFGIISSTFGLQFHKLIGKKQFESQVEKLQSQLQTAYDLVLNYDIDITVHFKKEHRHLLCLLSCDNPEIFKGIPKKGIYKRLRNFEVDNQYKSDLSFTISYFGSKSSTHCLTFSYPDCRPLSFELKGFPHVIKKIL